MIGSEWLSGSTLGVGYACFLLALCWALWRAPWLELVSDLRRQHVLFGTMFGLFVLWMVRRDFDSGLSFHFIGMTVVTLLLDWPLAVVAGAAAQLGLLAVGRLDSAAFGVNGCLLVLLPVLIAHGCAQWVERAQPRNLFVYIFACGFFPAALTALVCLSAGVSLLWLDGLLPLAPWLEDFAGYVWLVMFPEAFVNGMVLTGLVVFCPTWLEVFNRTRYLQAPWRADDTE